jgi:nitroreductase
MPEPTIERRPVGAEQAENPTQAMLETCVLAATTAPSIHNGQPWLFRTAPTRARVPVSINVINSSVG